MKLDVGMYVRYDGRIFKLDEYNIKGWKMYFEFIGTDNFQASHNIIDLIEENDYVNGYEVKCKMKSLLGFEDGQDSDWYMGNENIKSIVTKEQFSQMEYKVV